MSGGVTIEQRSRFLGLRSPAERAIGVEAIPALPSTLAFFQESARLDDVRRLRERLFDTRVNSIYTFDRMHNKVFDFQGWEQRERLRLRVSRVCEWARKRMKRADDAWAARYGRETVGRAA